MADQTEKNEARAGATAEAPRVSRAKKNADFVAQVKIDFVEWLAMPKEARHPKTQREFARLHGVHESTLSSWREGLASEVERIVKTVAVYALPDVMENLKRLARGGPDIPPNVVLGAIQTYLSYVHGWDPKNPAARDRADGQKVFNLGFGDERELPAGQDFDSRMVVGPIKKSPPN